MCPNNAFQPIGRDHEEDNLLDRDRRGRVRALSEERHLTKEITLAKRTEHTLLTVDRSSHLDPASVHEVRLSFCGFALAEDYRPDLKRLRRHPGNST